MDLDPGCISFVLLILPVGSGLFYRRSDPGKIQPDSQSVLEFLAFTTMLQLKFTKRHFKRNRCVLEVCY